MPESVLEPLKTTLLSGYVGQGPRVREFEHDLIPWCGSEHVLALNNGTAALQLALRLAGVGPGDEVITTAMTSPATNVPILAMGGKIVWADINPWTGNIDSQDVHRKITTRTKAVIAVHWGGYPCDLQELTTITTTYGLKLIEDACHAFGASYQGRPLGSISDFTCFSFQAIKIMTTVDGGALICKSLQDYERGKLLRWYGMDREGADNDIREYGYKMQMNDVTAAIGIEQLHFVKNNINAARHNSEKYDQAFSGLSRIKVLPRQNDRKSNCWLYTLRINDLKDFIEYMHAVNISTAQIHTRNDTYTAFKDYQINYKTEQLPSTAEFMSEYVCIPVGWWLSPVELDYICTRIRNF